jgi:hypothetical protein
MKKDTIGTASRATVEFAMRALPHNHLLTDSKLTPEQRHVIELAFNSTLRKLGLVERNDPLCALIARKMIDIYKRGVTDAVALTEITVREIGPPPSVRDGN